MILGFTGTRMGCSIEQKKACKRQLIKHKPVLVAHGGCVGGDQDFDLIAWILNIRRRCYPGAVPGIYRAIPVAAYEEKFPIRDPLVRNADIVAVSDFLIACPATHEEVRRSGTWSTIRLARTLRKPMIIISPDGTTREYDVKGTETTTWTT